MGEWVTLADGSKLFCPYPLEQRPLREEESEEPNSQSWHVALALASVLGFTGAHRFYTGKIATAIVWLLTGGLLGLGALADVAAIAASRWKAADGTPLRRRAAKGSLAAAGMAVGWAFVAWMTTAATRARLRRWPSSTAWQRGPEMMNYDELYRELERDAREAGLEKEHLEWQLGLEGWAKDPVAVAMRDWRLQHAPETLEGKSEEQVGREMAMVHLLAESRRTAAAQAWMRSPQSSQAKDAQQKAALMNAAAAAENEAMISEIPDIAISL